MEETPLEIIILAAGQGTRMRSSLPKVLHPLGSKPLLAHVIETAKKLTPKTIHLVYGAGGDQVHTYFKQETVHWVLQSDQKGTGHAVQQALPAIDPKAQVLILYGDVPLITPETLQQLLAINAALCLITCDSKDPNGFGRIIRHAAGTIIQIVEEKDATPDQKKIREINSGILAAKASDLTRWLSRITPNNAQQEYYLTEIVACATCEGKQVAGLSINDPNEVQGVNNRLQLAELERYYQTQQANHLLLQGVTLRDPQRFDLRGELIAGYDVTIDINVIIEGHVTLGNHVTIGANSFLRDVVIADQVTIKPNSILEESQVGSHCTIGPFARIRTGTQLAAHAQIGNFVETKQTTVGTYSKINHLSYMGDMVIGEQVNIGAGAIHCNYDGEKKHQTLVHNHAFIGSNVALVGPLTIGEHAMIGAGSTITKPAPPDQLTLARSKQQSIPRRKTKGSL